MSDYIKQSKVWREYFEENKKEFSKQFSDTSGKKREEWKEIIEINDFISQKKAFDLKITSLLYDNGGLGDFLDHHNLDYLDKLLEFIRFGKNLLGSEDIFEDYQGRQFGIKPTSAIIKRFYEEKIKKIPHYDEFEKINKKVFGNYLPELLGLDNNDLDKYDISVLQDCAKDKEQFSSYATSKNKTENWKIFKQLKPVFKDTQTKANYDNYYRFLCCKSLLRNLLIDGEHVELENYKTVEVAIREITSENEKKIATLIQEFCDKVGLSGCDPITDIDWEKYNNDERGDYKRQLDAKIQELKALQAKAIPLLKKIKEDAINWLLSNKLEDIEDSPESLKQRKTYELISKKTETEMNDVFKLLESTRQKIEAIKIDSINTFDFVKKGIDNAIAEYTPENVNKKVRSILSSVTTQFNKVHNAYSDFIQKYGENFVEKETKRYTDLKTLLKQKCTMANTEIKNKCAKLFGDTIIKQQGKRITKAFLLLQILLLIAFWIIYMPICLSNQLQLKTIEFLLMIANIIALIIFVIRKCIQFYQYNKAVKSKANYFNITKKDYYSEGKLYGHIITFVIFFILLQTSLLIKYNGL